MKKFLKRIAKSKAFKYWNLFQNYFEDFRLYLVHSNVFKIDNLNKKEAKLILDYHALEKGMLFQNMKAGFGKERVTRLHKLMTDEDVVSHLDRSQIRIAFQVMCKYFELHKEKNIDISGFFTDNQYQRYKTTLNSYYNSNFEGAIACDKTTFYENNHRSFDIFAHSRKSVRNFTGELVDKSLIKKAVELALTSPSV